MNFPFKEEMLLIGGNYHTEFPFPFHQLRIPAEEFIPIVAARLIENLVAVYAYDIMQAVLGIRILRGAEKPTT